MPREPGLQSLLYIDTHQIEAPSPDLLSELCFGYCKPTTFDVKLVISEPLAPTKKNDKASLIRET